MARHGGGGGNLPVVLPDSNSFCQSRLQEGVPLKWMRRTLGKSLVRGFYSHDCGCLIALILLTWVIPVRLHVLRKLRYTHHADCKLGTRIQNPRNSPPETNSFSTLHLNPVNCGFAVHFRLRGGSSPEAPLNAMIGVETGAQAGLFPGPRASVADHSSHGSSGSVQGQTELREPGDAPDSVMTDVVGATNSSTEQTKPVGVKRQRRTRARNANSTQILGDPSAGAQNRTKRVRAKQRASTGNATAAKQKKEIKIKPGPKTLKRCEFPEGCTAPAKKVLYGDPITGARFCREHREPHHYNLPNRFQLCRHEGCVKYGLFGDAEQQQQQQLQQQHHLQQLQHSTLHNHSTPPPLRFPACHLPKFCKLHKLPHHVDVRNPRCVALGCSRRASFGQRFSGRGPRFCREHAESGDVNLHAKTCEEEGCRIMAYFGAVEEGKARWCEEHRSPEHLDLRNRRCIGVMSGYNVQTGAAGTYACTNRASFGKANGIALFCSLHREDGNVNLQVSRCEVEGCKVTPSYSSPNERRRRFCKRHCPEGFVDKRVPPPMPNFF